MCYCTMEKIQQMAGVYIVYPAKLSEYQIFPLCRNLFTCED